MHDKTLFIYIVLFSAILYGCKNTEEQTKTIPLPTELNDPIAVLDEKPVDTIHIDVADFVACPGVIEQITSMFNIKPSKKLIKDWVVPIMLFPYKDTGRPGLEDMYRDQDSITKTIATYFYKDSIHFYIHTYKDHKQKPIIMDRVVSLNKELAVLEVNRKAGERYFFYFADDKDKNDIVLLDIPPNWDYWQLREE